MDNFLPREGTSPSQTRMRQPPSKVLQLSKVSASAQGPATDRVHDALLLVLSKKQEQSIGFPARRRRALIGSGLEWGARRGRSGGRGLAPSLKVLEQ